MVRFNKKESEARKELLASMNQVNDHDVKENDNGKVINWSVKHDIQLNDFVSQEINYLNSLLLITNNIVN